ncbi:FAD-binding protein [Escherichia coli]
MLATGGAGRFISPPLTPTLTLATASAWLSAGVPVQDMEMWQFHPTGIASAGILVTKVAVVKRLSAERTWRTLYGALCANTKDLAGRDVVARSIMIEIREGRGCDGPWGPHAN